MVVHIYTPVLTDSQPITANTQLDAKEKDFLNKRTPYLTKTPLRYGQIQLLAGQQNLYWQNTTR